MMHSDHITHIIQVHDYTWCAGQDGSIAVWHTKKHKVVALLEQGHTGPIQVLCQLRTRDGDVVLSGGQDKTISVWRA